MSSPSTPSPPESGSIAPSAAQAPVDAALATAALQGARPRPGESTCTDSFCELIRTSSRHCRELLDCEVTRIWIARPGSRHLAVLEREPSGEALRERRAPRGEGLAGWVVEHGRPLRVGPGEPRPPVKGEMPDFRSALVVPLFRRGAAFAAVECLDRRGGGSFTEADLERLEAEAEHLGSALDNALLNEELERRALEKDLLFEITKTLSAPHDLDDVIEAIFRALRRVVRYDAAAIYLVNPKTTALELVSEAGYPSGSDEAFQLHVGVGLVGWVAKTGEAVIVPDVLEDPRYVAARPETRSELAAPLLLEGRAIGVFNLESDREGAFHEGDLDLLVAFASQAAVAVERARSARELLERKRLEKELAIAREIQVSFLPRSAPQIPGFEFAGVARTHAEVGGDYYDFIRLSETRLGLAIADCSGKGIPAALLMAGFRMSLLAEIRNEFAIRAVMRKANSLLHESTERDKFVTAFYGVLDCRNRALIFSNAGHNPPLLARAGGAIECLTEGGVALGVLPHAQYEDCAVALRPRDVLLLYTDGVSEAESPAGEQLGQPRLERILADLAGKSAQEILDGVVEAVLEWTGERGQSDDLTLMVVKVLPDDR